MGFRREKRLSYHARGLTTAASRSHSATTHSTTHAAAAHSTAAHTGAAVCRRFVGQGDAAFFGAHLHFFMVLRANLLALFDGFGVPHPLPVFHPFLLGHHLAAINGLLRLVSLGDLNRVVSDVGAEDGGGRRRDGESRKKI
jgi:hypothetical protein